MWRDRSAAAAGSHGCTDTSLHDKRKHTVGSEVREDRKNKRLKFITWNKMIKTACCDLKD